MPPASVARKRISPQSRRPDTKPQGDRLSNRAKQTKITPANRYVTLSWDQIQSWQQDNEYILSGYRPATGSFRNSLKTITHIHNETVNIFSHLVGAILFATLPIWVYSEITPRYGNGQLSDIVVFSTFFGGVAICFSLSACFHIVANHSAHVHRVGNQLDYLGIVILMWGSTIPSVYYGFYCDPAMQRLYWAVCTLLGTGCIYATLHPRFRHPALRPYRSAMYTGFGLSAIVFIVHGVILYGWALQRHRMALQWMALMAALNLVGATTYAARVPERWFPRTYDIFGSSHQVLHFMVVFAGLAHMVGLIHAFDYLHSQASPCS